MRMMGILDIAKSLGMEMASDEVVILCFPTRIGDTWHQVEVSISGDNELCFRFDGQKSTIANDQVSVLRGRK